MITYHATKYNFVHGNWNYQCAVTPHHGWVFHRWPLGKIQIPPYTFVVHNGEWKPILTTESVDYFKNYTDIERFLENETR